MFVYNCVMGTDGCNTSWESSWRVIGSKGSLIWDGFGQPYAELRPDPQKWEFERIELTSDWDGQYQHLGCLDEMFDALLAGRPSDTDCHDNLKSINMVFASIDSSLQCKKIPVV